jgi:hypothetical protein
VRPLLVTVAPPQEVSKAARFFGRVQLHREFVTGFAAATNVNAYSSHWNGALVARSKKMERTTMYYSTFQPIYRPVYPAYAYYTPAPVFVYRPYMAGGFVFIP